MHCLRWWLPIFLLPLPAASPFLLLLFIISYVIRTKPCAYCSVIIIGLMLSTCSFYQYSPLQNITPTQSTSEKEKAIPGFLPISAITTSASSSTHSSPPTTDAATTTTSEEKQQQPSSCWIDFTHNNSGKDSKMNLGKWSAHTWRRYPSILSQSINLDQEGSRNSSSLWKRLLHDGIFIGLNDVGFRLKFIPE